MNHIKVAIVDIPGANNAAVFEAIKGMNHCAVILVDAKEVPAFTIHALPEIPQLFKEDIPPDSTEFLRSFRKKRTKFKPRSRK